MKLFNKPTTAEEMRKVSEKNKKIPDPEKDHREKLNHVFKNIRENANHGLNHFTYYGLVPHYDTTDLLISVLESRGYTVYWKDTCSAYIISW